MLITKRIYIQPTTTTQKKEKNSFRISIELNLTFEKTLSPVFDIYIYIHYMHTWLSSQLILVFVLKSKVRDSHNSRAVSHSHKFHSMISFNGNPSVSKMPPFENRLFATCKSFEPKRKSLLLFFRFTHLGSLLQRICVEVDSVSNRYFRVEHTVMLCVSTYSRTMKARSIISCSSSWLSSMSKKNSSR